MPKMPNYGSGRGDGEQKATAGHPERCETCTLPKPCGRACRGSGRLDTTQGEGGNTASTPARGNRPDFGRPADLQEMMAAAEAEAQSAIQAAKTRGGSHHTGRAAGADHLDPELASSLEARKVGAKERSAEAKRKLVHLKEVGGVGSGGICKF